MSYLLAPVAISSMPQHAVANGIGQREFLLVGFAYEWKKGVFQWD